MEEKVGMGRGRGRGRGSVPPGPGDFTVEVLPEGLIAGISLEDPITNVQSTQGNRPPGRGRARIPPQWLQQNVEDLLGLPVSGGRAVVASDSESGPIPLDGGLGSWRIPPIRPMEPNLLFRGLGRSRSYTRVVPPGYRNAYTFKLNDLVRPPSLSDYKGKNSFLITSNSGNELTDMYIIPAKDRDLKRLAIADQISTHIRKGLDEIKMKYVPELGDVILAQRTSSSEYTRCSVSTVWPESDRWVQLEEIDTGLEFIACWNNVLTVTPEIMALPVMGYKVVLDLLPERLGFIFQKDVDAMIRRVRLSKMEVTVVGRTASHLKVKLTRRGCGAGKSFGEQVMGLGKWEWERVLELGICRTDDEILKRGVWPSVCYPKDFYAPSLPNNAYFEAEVLANISITPDPPLRHIIVYLKPLTRQAENNKGVLEAQVERYMRMVKPSPFYPAIMEKVFIRPPDGHAEGGKWHRMVRVDHAPEVFYNVDRHILMRISPSDDKFEYRKMLPDFVRIPKMVLEAALSGYDVSDEEVRTLLESTFKKGTTLQILIDSSENSDESCPYPIIRCKEVEVGVRALEKKRFSATIVFEDSDDYDY